MPDFLPATLAAHRPVGASYVALSLAVPEAVSQGFTRPGQYHQVSVDGVNAAYLAVASAPGTGSFEYLLKRGGKVADELLGLPVGAPVHVTTMMGRGFPGEQAQGRTLLLVGSGTGFAPLRSVLTSLVSGSTGPARIAGLWGLRHEADLAWPGELADWRARGHDVQVTLSQPGAGWTGLVGHVQAHLERLPVDDALVFLVGQKALVADVKAALAARGVGPERVFTNG